MDIKPTHIILLISFLFSGVGFSHATEVSRKNSVINYTNVDDFSTSSAPAEAYLSDPQNLLNPEDRKNYLQRKSDNIPHKSFWTQAKEDVREKLIEVGHSILGPRAKPVFNYVVKVIFDVPLLIVLTILIIAFLFNVLVAASIVFITNLVKNTRDKYKEALRLRYEEVLTNYIFEEIEAQEAIEKMEQVKTSLGRKTLIEILFNFQNNLSGEYSERILLLYQRLGLQYESIRKISSIFFHKRVQGIRELANMYPSGAKNIIVSYIKDKNDIVRGEAQIAYVHLDEEASFDFLDDLKRPFSQWAQLNALNFVKLHEKEVPSFKQWMQSPNNDIQDFSVRMTNFFQQSESASELISMLNHENERTRLYIYQAIKSLNLLEAKEIVKGRYEIETQKNKLEIINLLPNIGDESDFDFLDYLLRGDDIEVKLAVCKTLYRMGQTGQDHLEELKENKNLDLAPYIEHIKDPRN